MSGQIGLFGTVDEEPDDDSTPAAGAASKSARAIGPAMVGDELRQLGEQLPPGIHMGTSSWSFPGWAGIVYDKPASESALSRRGLAAYSRHPLLRAAGIDRSFYNPMSLAEYAE